MGKIDIYKKILIWLLLLTPFMTGYASNQRCHFNFWNLGPNSELFFTLQPVPANYTVFWAGGSCYADEKLYPRNDCVIAIYGNGDCQNADFQLLDPKGNIIHVYMEYLSEQAGPQVSMTYPTNLFNITLEPVTSGDMKRYDITIYNK